MVTFLIVVDGIDGKDFLNAMATVGYSSGMNNPRHFHLIQFEGQHFFSNEDADKKKNKIRYAS